MKYYEDIELGVENTFGQYKVTREEVVEFASKYDPQAFHLDDEAAAHTYFGRLSASGWHTCAMMMAMNVANFKSEKIASLGSPGVDEIRWLTPVYPGDTLRCVSETIEKRRSKSRPDIGLTRSKTTVFNQHDKPVMTVVVNGMIKVRNRDGTD